MAGGEKAAKLVAVKALGRHGRGGHVRGGCMYKLGCQRRSREWRVLGPCCGLSRGHSTAVNAAFTTVRHRM